MGRISLSQAEPEWVGDTTLYAFSMALSAGQPRVCQQPYVLFSPCFSLSLLPTRGRLRVAVIFAVAGRGRIFNFRRPAAGEPRANSVPFLVHHAPFLAHRLDLPTPAPGSFVSLRCFVLLSQHQRTHAETDQTHSALGSNSLKRGAGRTETSLPRCVGG